MAWRPSYTVWNRNSKHRQKAKAGPKARHGSLLKIGFADPGGRRPNARPDPYRSTSTQGVSMKKFATQEEAIAYVEGRENVAGLGTD